MTPWRWSAIFAIITIALSVVFPAIPNINACGVVDTAGSWVALQRAQSASAFDAIIRPDCAPLLMPALRTSFWLDALAYIPVYAAFLFFAMTAAARTAPRPLHQIGLAALVIAIICDQVEGVSLALLLSERTDDPVKLGLLSWSYNGKVFFLGLTSLFIGLMLTWQRGVVRIVGVSIAIAGICALTVRGFGGQLSYPGLFVSWLLIALTAFFRSLKSR